MALESRTFTGSRFGATLEQMSQDIQEGIKGKDIVGDLVRGGRNAVTALWHGVQGVIPSVANAFGNQQFSVVRRNGSLHGTSNSVHKIFATKGIFGKASAILAELTDGPVDDAFSVVGAGQWMIVPQTRKQTSHLMNNHSGTI